MAYRHTQMGTDEPESLVRAIETNRAEGDSSAIS